MSDTLTLLRRAVSQHEARPAHTWDELLGAMRVVTSAEPSVEADDLYLRILRFDGSLRLAPGSHLPHSMSPDETLKALAIHALGDRASSAHRDEITRLQSAAKSPRLAAAAKKYLATPQGVNG